MNELDVLTAVADKGLTVLILVAGLLILWKFLQLVITQKDLLHAEKTHLAAQLAECAKVLEQAVPLCAKIVSQVERQQAQTEIVLRLFDRTLPPPKDGA